MYKLTLSLVLLICSNFIHAETSVWKAEKDGAVVYLGGTVHMLSKSDYPLPEEFEQAYKASKIITFETDIATLSSPALQAKAMTQLTYQDGKTVKSVTSPETYKALEKYASSVGFPLAAMPTAKPGMLMSAFLLMELQRMGITPDAGVETFFQNKGNIDGKSFDYLETPEEQLGFMAEMGIGNEDKFYQYMIRDMKNISKDFKKMVAFWRDGESEKLNAFMNAAMKDFPNLQKLLLTDRNKDWISDIEKYFNTKEVEFILVGAAHLVGKHSVINMLKNKGYKITKL